jgi:manganese transport protein
MGLFKRDDYPSRLKYRNRMVWALTVIPVCIFYIDRDPVRMVFIGGMAQFLMMPVIGIGTVYLRHKHLPHDVAPSPVRTAFLWFTSAVLVGFVALYFWTLIRG